MGENQWTLLKIPPMDGSLSQLRRHLWIAGFNSNTYSPNADLWKKRAAWNKIRQRKYAVSWFHHKPHQPQQVGRQLNQLYLNQNHHHSTIPNSWMAFLSIMEVKQMYFSKLPGSIPKEIEVRRVEVVSQIKSKSD